MPKIETTKTNLEQLSKFIAAANNYLKAHQAPSKLNYALKKMSTKYVKHFEEYNNAARDNNELIQDARALHAATDKDGVILTNADGTFKFTPKGDIALRKEIRELDKAWEEKRKEFFSQEIEVECFFVDVSGLELTDDYIEAFENFVIEPLPEEKES